MSFFISDAFAQGSSAQELGIAGVVFPLAILVVFYFLFIRPQTKRQQEHKDLLASLKKGTEVITNGGLLGKVVDIDDNFVELEVCDNMHIQVQRKSVATIVPKGTFKSTQKKKSGSA